MSIVGQVVQHFNYMENKQVYKKSSLNLTKFKDDFLFKRVKII